MNLRVNGLERGLISPTAAGHWAYWAYSLSLCVHAMSFYTTVCGFDLLTDVDSTLESGDMGEIFMLLSFN